MLTLLVTATLAAAPFEGVLEYQLRVRNAEGSVKTYVSKLGVRSEAVLPFGSAKSETTVLVKADAPGTSLVWSADKKAFVAQAPQPTQREVTRSEAVGEMTVLELKCQRVRLYEAEGFTEYCVAKDALKDAKRDRLVMSAQRLDAQTVAALARHGAAGLVVKLTHVTRGEPDLTMELVSLKRVPVDAKLMQ